MSGGIRGVGLPAYAEAQLKSRPMKSQSVLTLFILKHYSCAFFSFTLRLKQERELVLTQLSHGLATELTELVVTECVRETCSQELK